MRKHSKTPKKSSLSQYGLMDIPGTMDDDDDDISDMSDNDDFEAELAAIIGGNVKAKPKRPAPATNPNLDVLIAQSLKDVSDGEDDVASEDENDPELLNELQSLATDDHESLAPPPRVARTAPQPPGGHKSSIVSVLEDRISNYTLSEKNAKAAGESSRARRFGRGLKTLNDLLKQAKQGKDINSDDIPPQVSVGKNPQQDGTKEAIVEPNVPVAQTDPVAPVDLLTSSDPVAENDPVTPIDPLPPSAPEPSSPPPKLPPRLNVPSPVETSQPDPKQESLQFILKRKEEFKAAALSAKQVGDKALALELLKVFKQFDLVVDAFNSGQEMDLNELPTPQAITEAIKSQEPKSEENVPEQPAAPAPVSSPGELVKASSVDEALKQRLEVFKEREQQAREQNNSSKQRRMARIVKQYEDAIKLNSLGKPIPIDELPDVPGLAPIPVEQAKPKPAPSQPSPGPSPTSRVSQKANQMTRAEKQLIVLIQKQKKFKEAAIKAKQSGNIEQAKEFLRAAKGFDSVIEAARAGLAVDFTSLPVLPDDKPALESNYDLVSAEDCLPPEEIEGDVFAYLLDQLNSQLKLCLTTRDHYKAMAGVTEMNRFDNLAVGVTHDLNLVKIAKKTGRDPPKFHFVSRQFSILQCNTDLNENDLELTIVRGVAYNVPNPKDVDTYVKFEYPYPPETPVSDRTNLIKDTNAPEYNAVFTLAIDRSTRACQRLFKRHGIKFEVYSRGGWFSKDTLIGTAMVKLAHLESHVTLHESFPLMDGRRPAGGSLEVKLRVRTPILQQQFENTTHKWLCIDTDKI